MPAQSSLVLAASKIARLALSTQISMARRTSRKVATAAASRNQRPNSSTMRSTAMALATSPAL